MMKSKVSRCQQHKYCSSQNQLISCEEELGRLLNSQPPISETDLNKFISHKSELMAKLAHLRSIEGSCWLKKIEN